MRAAVMRDKKLLVDEVVEPEPGPGQVLVKTLACGICGSDLHMLQHAERMIEIGGGTGIQAGIDLSRDLVMGHEFCAEILDHGPGTERTLAAGTRVCSVPIAFGADGVETVGYSNRNPGGYGERMVLNEPLLLEVPNGLSAEHAALTEPMAVGEHAVVKGQLEEGALPLVIGCGPVGLSVVIALRRRGLGPVIAADFSPARRALAERLGADVVIDPATRSPYECWEQMAAPEGADPVSPLQALGVGPQPRAAVFFECVGVPGLLQQLMEGAPRGGRIVVAGVCMERDHVEPIYGINKELCVQFVLGYSPDEFAATLRRIAEGAIDVEPLVTGKVGVDGVPTAFEELASPERHAKIIVEPWR